MDCVFVSLSDLSHRFLDTANMEFLDVFYLDFMCFYIANIWSNSCTADASAGLGPNGGEDGVDNGEGGEQAAWQGARWLPGDGAMG